MKVSNHQLTKIAENILSDIHDSVNLEELYSETEILLHVGENYNPEDVFSEAVLSDWAFENGFRKFE